MPISNHDKTTTNDRAEVVITDEGTGKYAQVETFDGKERLLVDASINGDVTVTATASNTEQKIDYLKNGTAVNMAVNGSVTPVEYKYQPSSGIWQIDSLKVLLGCSSDTDSTDFGGQPAITNGLKLAYTISSTEYTVATMQCNLCINAVFHDESVSGMTDSKWLKDTGGRYYIGSLDLQDNSQLVTLDSSNNDKISVYVQDDLTNQDIIYLRIAYHARRSL
jgi:hypothetical protein